MKMQPIVNGLQDEFSDSIAFVSLNANDGGIGQQAFQQLQLGGHPSIVILGPQGEEYFRVMGAIDPGVLRKGIEETIRDR